MLGVISAIVYAIGTTGKATQADVAKGAVDAIQKAEKQADKGK